MGKQRYENGLGVGGHAKSGESVGSWSTGYGREESGISLGSQVEAGL